MGWTVAQQKRLGMEKDLLSHYFRGRVTWIEPTGNTRVEVRMTASNDKNYTLRIYLPPDFPNSCPTMVVSNPNAALRKLNGSLLTRGSDEDHTYGSRDGLTVICHFRPNRWSNENTLYQVFMKGLIWLEAYEGHLRTGKPINTFLRDM